MRNVVNKNRIIKLMLYNRVIATIDIDWDKCFFRNGQISLFGIENIGYNFCDLCTCLCRCTFIPLNPFKPFNFLKPKN